MLSDRKTRALQKYIAGLPQETVARLAQLVERDALHDGMLPHEDLMILLRPQLRLSRLPRLISPMRAFCTPFEDLLQDAPMAEKHKGCIARISLKPVWAWLGRDLIPDTVRDYVGDFKSFIMAGEIDNAEQCARGFRRAAGEAMLDALAVDARAVRAALGQAVIVADAEEMALLAAGEATMAEIKTLFPKPLPGLTEAHMNGFRVLYERTLNEMPDLVPYLPVAAMGRLEKPWQAVRLALLVARKRSETMLAATDMGLVGDILFARLEEARGDIQNWRRPDFDVEALLDRLTDFTLLASGISGEVELLRSGRWGKRLVAGRAAVAAILEAHLDRAAKAVAAVLPLKSNAKGRRTKIIDLDKEVGEEAAANAYRYARLVAGCRYLAGAASFQVKYDTVREEVVSLIDFYNDAILIERVDTSKLMQPLIDQQFKIAHTLTAIVHGREQADLFARRDAMTQVA